LVKGDRKKFGKDPTSTRIRPAAAEYNEKDVATNRLGQGPVIK
jgi:hypothetical protein